MYMLTIFFCFNFMKTIVDGYDIHPSKINIFENSNANEPHMQSVKATLGLVTGMFIAGKFVAGLFVCF